MRFRLLYSGPLFGASRNDTRSSHKHEIRKVLSPQLRRLWEIQPVLKELATDVGREHMPHATPEDEEKQWLKLSHATGIEKMASNWKCKSSRFVPLVTQSVATRCRIDILFLRPGEPGSILQGGDIDNRIKTLFDAFRLPRVAQETVDDGQTWFVLLEDDSLISEVSVVTDNLLQLPNTSEVKPTDALLVIDVQIEALDEADYDWVWRPGRLPKGGDGGDPVADCAGD